MIGNIDAKDYCSLLNNVGGQIYETVWGQGEVIIVGEGDWNEAGWGCEEEGLASNQRS
jgi:hypothetical protein